MNILLVYPKCPEETFWSFRYALPFTGKKAAFPPLGLLTVAAWFPEDWRVRLVDENIRKLRNRDLVWADAVFLSAMLIQRESAIQVIEQCHAKGKKVIAGGPLFSADPSGLRGIVDTLCLGEAESYMRDLVEDLRQGVERLKPVYQVASGTFPKMSESPLPQWKIIRKDMKKYSSMVIQWGRGCPYDCEFCDVTKLFGRKVRLKLQEQIINDLQRLYNMKWQGSIFCVDDNFIGNKQKAKEMLRAIIAWQRDHRYPFTLYTQTDITLADDEELLRLMVEAGFTRVFIGIETVNEAGLAETGKTQNLGGKLLEKIRTIQREGLEVQAGLIVGFDSDTPEIFTELFLFLQEAGIVTAMVGQLQPLPGTRLRARYEREGRLLSPYISGNLGNNSDPIVKYLPAGMSPVMLQVGYQSMIRDLYCDPKRYSERLSVLLAEIAPVSRHRKAPFLWDVFAFLRSMVQIGLFSKARRYYWQSLLWALHRKPSVFSLAVVHWIFWAHYSRIGRRISQIPCAEYNGIHPES